MEKTRPKISIVTPSYNQASFIEEALLSVKNQDYSPIEHIVVDGCSCDGTVEILKYYSGLPGWGHLRWISEPDQGQSDALNKGFKMATGEIIGWLNSDDRYRPKCFSSVASALARMPETDVLYGDYAWIDASGNCLQIRKEIEFNRFVLAHHRVLWIASTATFFRRLIFDRNNFIDIRYHHAMDYEFFVRLAYSGYRFSHIGLLLADFRWHDQSKTGTMVEKQFVERDQIVAMYSPIISKVRNRRILLPIVRRGTQFLAAARRYSEKALRGYYFDQFKKATKPGRESEQRPR